MRVFCGRLVFCREVFVLLFTKMETKNFLKIFNLFGYCKKYGLGPWQCPQFLFLVMGTIISFCEIFVYFLGKYYIEDTQIVILIVMSLTGILFVISFTIVKGFENLAEANRMKSEFISVVSHQLRSPLSNLSWTLDLLMSGRVGKIEDNQVEYFKILKENNGRMKDLVSSLLIVSRLQSATMSFNNEIFHPREMMEESIKSFLPYAKASNVEVSFRAQPDLPPIFADKAQTRMIFENLLDNAIRYVKGKGDVLVSLEKDGKNLRFSIRDTGVGIPKKDQKYIFQKFFRSENAMRHQTQGSGLGLYIAKSIIEKSKGKIWFESQEGKGTMFCFLLPVAKKTDKNKLNIQG